MIGEPNAKTVKAYYYEVNEKRKSVGDGARVMRGKKEISAKKGDPFLKDSVWNAIGGNRRGSSTVCGTSSRKKMRSCEGGTHWRTQGGALWTAQTVTSAQDRIFMNRA